MKRIEKKLLFNKLNHLILLKVSLLGLTFFIYTQNYAQDKSETQKHIQTLTSKDYFGRGYLQEGHQKAAKYLSEEYFKLNLANFTPDDEYLQYFTIPINTHPKTPQLYIDGKALNFGQDFIITPSAGDIDFKGEIRCVSYKKLLRKKSLEKKFEDQVVYIQNPSYPLDDQAKKIIYQNPWRAKAIILPGQKKLTHRMAQKQEGFAVIELTDHVSTASPKNIDIQIDAEYQADLKTQNVIGFVPGTLYPDSYLIFTAHYDHLGGVGGVYFPGANDNASGTAMLLHLAQYYAKHPHKYSMVFMAFGAEEVGLLGSKYFVEHPLFPLPKIKFLLNMDMMGTGDEGIQVVNATELPKAFETLQKINQEKNYLFQIKPRGKAANSDHYWFSEQGVPAFFIYTLGGVAHYHDVLDKAETLPLTEFEDVFQLLIDFYSSF